MVTAELLSRHYGYRCIEFFYYGALEFFLSFVSFFPEKMFVVGGFYV